MQTAIFTQWFQHFMVYANPSKERPVLLVLDGHSTHVKNTDAIETARANGVIIMCLPPHVAFNEAVEHVL